MEYIINISKFMLKGTALTISLYSLTFIVAIIIGVTAALYKVKREKQNFIYDFYTWLFRGTPLLLQLFFIYFGLPVIGIKLSGFQSAVLAFSLNYGAYLAEIFRGGINAVEKGQYEAAKALGISKAVTMKSIILPQAFKKIVPSLCNESITLIKDTALVAAIGLGDLLRAAKQIVTRDVTVMPFFLAAVFYLFFTAIIVLIFKKIEYKLNYYEQ